MTQNADKHAHWSMFDPELEGKEYRKLQDIFEMNQFAPTAAGRIADNLVNLAHCMGEGEADTFYTDTAHLSPTEIEGSDYHSSRRTMVFERFADGDYFAAHGKSAEILLATNPSDEKAQFVQDLQRGIRQSYQAGLDIRTERFAASTASTPKM